MGGESCSGAGPGVPAGTGFLPAPCTVSEGKNKRLLLRPCGPLRGAFRGTRVVTSVRPRSGTRYGCRGCLKDDLSDPPDSPGSGFVLGRRGAGKSRENVPVGLTGYWYTQSRVGNEFWRDASLPVGNQNFTLGLKGTGRSGTSRGTVKGRGR